MKMKAQQGVAPYGAQSAPPVNADVGLNQIICGTSIKQ